MIIVSNTGPLIALAKLDQMDLLPRLVPDGVFIPDVIQRELWAKSGFESPILQTALNNFIQIKEPEQVSAAVKIITLNLDEGEKQAIRLASTINQPLLLLLDDNAGRKAAKKLNLPITGTVGLLLKAKEKGLITAVMPLIEQLRAYNYWLSDALVASVKKISGE